ncbi:hypothetical protein AB5I41_04655 [Sphingomonas sp. MMS24-JH45]
MIFPKGLIARRFVRRAFFCPLEYAKSLKNQRRGFERGGLARRRDRPELRTIKAHLLNHRREESHRALSHSAIAGGGAFLVMTQRDGDLVIDKPNSTRSRSAS